MKFTRLMTTGGATVLIALGATTGTAAAGDAPERDTGAPVMLPGPPTYPEYDPMYEVPVVAQDTGDASSAALGALAGIALAGAGLGAAFAVARHRDHPAAPQSV